MKVQAMKMNTDVTIEDEGDGLGLGPSHGSYHRGASLVTNAADVGFLRMPSTIISVNSMFNLCSKVCQEARLSAECSLQTSVHILKYVSKSC